MYWYLTTNVLSSLMTKHKIEHSIKTTARKVSCYLIFFMLMGITKSVYNMDQSHARQRGTIRVDGLTDGWPCRWRANSNSSSARQAGNAALNCRPSASAEACNPAAQTKTPLDLPPLLPRHHSPRRDRSRGQQGFPTRSQFFFFQCRRQHLLRHVSAVCPD